MLFSLGLKRFPPIDVLLGIAAGRPPTNQKALDYLLANLQSHYVNFDPKSFEGVAFLPATLPDGRQILAKPGEVSQQLIWRELNIGIHELVMRHTRVRCGGSIYRFSRHRIKIENTD